MYSSREIRQKYLDFFKSKNHAVIPSASLIPDNDPTTLFVGSGMQPLVPYLLGEKHPAGTRLVNAQKSFRTEDIEEVGDNRHNTFFEMLGNWSLGDYFKKEQLEWIFTFFAHELKLDPSRMYVTVFRGNKSLGIEKDREAVKIWKSVFSKAGIKAKDIDLSWKNGMRGGRIFYYGDDKNWWSRTGTPDNMPMGEPGGPDSELFYDLGAYLRMHEKSGYVGKPCHVNCDCGRFIEIGNSVFMEYVRTGRGFKKLDQKNIDFGGGLERIAMIAQNKTNVFDTDLFDSIIRKIEGVSGKKYRENMKQFEIIADHLKAAVFLMGDDKKICPSNVDQGYVVRRLIRRAIRYGKQLGISEDLWTKKIAEVVVDDYKEVYPELGRNVDFVIREFEREEKKFKNTLERGIIEFEKMAPPAGVSVERTFYIYQSFGFPPEMTFELARERGWAFDQEKIEKGVREKMKEHQELSRSSSACKFKGGLADRAKETKKLHTATHLLLAALRMVLGSHVFQKGSNITSERLRFDFSHPEKLTDDQKQNVEKLVNKAIKDNLLVEREEMDMARAKELGIIGVFESKYGNRVKVYTIGIGKNVFSREICGGPHARRTGELGYFRITKEKSVSAGVRRIKAVLEKRL